MEIVTIFVDVNNEGLHSVCLTVGSINEYDKTFDQWYDPEYLLKYCKENQRELFGNFGLFKLEDFVEDVYKEVELLEDLFLDFRDNYLGVNNSRLQEIFKPLDNFQHTLVPLQPTKARIGPTKLYKYPVLRMYAIKISESSFIVTGGCIKFTFKMDDMPECKLQRIRLGRVIDFLKEESCHDQDDLNYYYESDSKD